MLTYLGACKKSRLNFSFRQEGISELALRIVCGCVLIMAALTLALALPYLLTIVRVCGHGHLSKPLARNAMGPSIDNGAVAGGPGTVHAFDDNSKQTTYQHGICGNAAGTPQPPQIYNRVGEPQARFTAGAIVNISVVITAHHVGFFEFELCDDAGQLSEECFMKHRLLKSGCTCDCPPPFAESNSCEECDACRRYWKPLQQGEVDRYGFASGYEGPILDSISNIVAYEFTMTYSIPASLRSKHAVLRWHYMTTNSCLVQSSAPEEFWNCADVEVEDRNGEVGDDLEFDNDLLERLEVKNLIPKIEDVTLLGVYSSCQDSGEGLLQIGSPQDYDRACGVSIPENNSFELCVEVPGPNATQICGAIDELEEGEILCESQCTPFFYECSNDIVSLLPLASGVQCKDNRQVVQAECELSLRHVSLPSDAIVLEGTAASSPRLLGASPQQGSLHV